MVVSVTDSDYINRNKEPNPTFLKTRIRTRIFRTSHSGSVPKNSYFKIRIRNNVGSNQALWILIIKSRSWDPKLKKSQIRTQKNHILKIWIRTTVSGKLKRHRRLVVWINLGLQFTLFSAIPKKWVLIKFFWGFVSGAFK